MDGGIQFSEKGFNRLVGLPRKVEMLHQSSEREEGIRIWFATAFPLDTRRNKCWLIFWQLH